MPRSGAPPHEKGSRPSKDPARSREEVGTSMVSRGR